MITFANTITIAIDIAIASAIFPVSPGPNAHIYATFFMSPDGWFL